MEMAQGGDLFERIISKKSFSEQEAARVVFQVASALQHLHARGIVHLDLKPENLLYTDDADNGQVKICDFGFASVIEEGTLLKKICGTPAYVAPEVVLSSGIIRCNGRGPNGFSTEVDMWSLGIITYVMLSGMFPFYADNIRASKSDQDKQVLRKIVAGRYSFPVNYWGEVSQGAKDLISHLLVRNPAQRLTATQVLHHPWVEERNNLSDNCLPSFRRLINYNKKRSDYGLAVHGLAGIVLTSGDGKKKADSISVGQAPVPLVSPNCTPEKAHRKARDTLSPPASLSASLIIREESQQSVLKEKSIQGLISLALSNDHGDTQRDACFALADLAFRQKHLVPHMLDEGAVSVLLKVLRVSKSNDARRFAALAVLNMMAASQETADFLSKEGGIETFNFVATEDAFPALVRKQASRVLCYVALHPKHSLWFSSQRSLQPIVGLVMQPLREVKEEATRALSVLCRSRQVAQSAVSLIRGIIQAKSCSVSGLREAAKCLLAVSRKDAEAASAIAGCDCTGELLTQCLRADDAGVVIPAAVCSGILARHFSSTNANSTWTALEGGYSDSMDRQDEVSLAVRYARKRIAVMKGTHFESKSASRGLLSNILRAQETTGQLPSSMPSLTSTHRMSWTVLAGGEHLMQDETGTNLRNAGDSWALTCLEHASDTSSWRFAIKVITDGPIRLGAVNEGYCGHSSVLSSSSWCLPPIDRNRSECSLQGGSPSPCRSVDWLFTDSLGTRQKKSTVTGLGDFRGGWGLDVHQGIFYEEGHQRHVSSRFRKGDTVILEFRYDDRALVVMDDAGVILETTYVCQNDFGPSSRMDLGESETPVSFFQNRDLQYAKSCGEEAVYQPSQPDEGLFVLCVCLGIDTQVKVEVAPQP
mmetsp:Transcript_47888/g.124314  ORF Transcript_47888/g.124314 Transcript_47888/m.124314 type:complete len:876 (+) Transcript_47888:485-3112(+)